MPIPKSTFRGGNAYSEGHSLKGALPYLLGVLVLATSTGTVAQDWSFEGNARTQAVFSTQEKLPFWIYTNTNYERGELSSASVYSAAQVAFTKGPHRWEVGLSGFLRDGVTDAVARRDLYLSYSNPWLQVVAGAKKQADRYDGLSATNGNFLWSNNARPLPGLRIEAPEPLRLNRTFSLDWGIAHYQLNDDRYVDGTWVHYKRLGLITKFSEQHNVLLQAQHVVQWGGTSPFSGDRPDDLEAFFKVFFAREDPVIFLNGEPGDNALGNHMGSFLLSYQWKSQAGALTFYREHPFEDGSGTGFQNFPDGIWGLHFAFKEKNFLDAVVYEFITTTNQSGDTGISSNDNYFTNAEYRSGWSYEGNIIGLPFIVFDRNVEIDLVNRPVTLNSLRAHHLAAKGTTGGWEYSLRTSFVERLGRASSRLEVPLENWYNYGTVSRAIQGYGIVGVVLGADLGNTTSPILAGGLTYSYSF